MNKWLIVLVALAAVGGGYKVYSSRKPVLNLAFKAAKAEKAITLDDMREIPVQERRPGGR